MNQREMRKNIATRSIVHTASRRDQYENARTSFVSSLALLACRLWMASRRE